VTQNIGDADRTIRMLIGVITALLFFQLPRGTASLILGVVSVLLLVAAVSGWSLLYFVLRISTRSDKDAKPLEPS
jgi:hypothetical protein